MRTARTERIPGSWPMKAVSVDRPFQSTTLREGGGGVRGRFEIVSSAV